MSLFKQLAKGFVRSAVNQVGRDGGRVISKKMYNTAHAAPVSVINEADNTALTHNYRIPPLQDESDSIVNRMALEKQGFKPIMSQISPIFYVFVLIGSIIIPILGPLYHIFLGSVHLFTKKLQFSKKVDTDNGKDTIISEFKFSPNTKERVQLLIKGILSVLVGLLIMYMQYTVYTNFQESQPTNISNTANDNNSSIKHNNTYTTTQCIKTTKKGKRCKNTTSNPNGLCHIHK